MIKTEKEGLLQLLKIATPFILITTVYTILVLGLEDEDQKLMLENQTS